MLTNDLCNIAVIVVNVIRHRPSPEKYVPSYSTPVGIWEHFVTLHISNYSVWIGQPGVALQIFVN